MLSQNRAVRRRLAASWPGYQDVTTPQWRETMLRTIKRAFPANMGDLDILVIASNQKRWDVIEVSERERLIVIDTSYSKMLARIQTAVLKAECPPIARHSLSHAVFGWALFTAGDYSRACSICARAFRTQGIEWLQELDEPSPARGSNAWIFALLHEAAHAMVDRPSVTSERAIEYAATAVEKIERHYRDFIKTLDKDRNFSNYSSLTGYDFTDATQWPRLRAQMVAQCAKVMGNNELNREIACDFLALSGALNLRLGNDPLGENARPLSADELRVCQSILVLAAESFEVMLAIANFRAMAASIRDRDVSATHGFSVELLARQNAMNHTCLTLLEHLPLHEDAEALRARAAGGFTFVRRRFEQGLITRLIDPISAINMTLHDDSSDLALHDDLAPLVSHLAEEFGVETDDEVGLAVALLNSLPV